ncbi:hypothetical protein GDO78_014696 [Eleutherodactylus coqui]|uniref:Uncharacterized protein n=1 Tax=Eleutherodactylus coqui TaxID=57060 RepID=A0A8J6EEA5_ELECQ|nr:hypothetical protein GDO78_014696 [Eleutherodactylus coqui]
MTRKKGAKPDRERSGGGADSGEKLQGATSGQCVEKPPELDQHRIWCSTTMVTLRHDVTGLTIDLPAGVYRQNQAGGCHSDKV